MQSKHVLGMLWEELTTVGVTCAILNDCGLGLIAVGGAQNYCDWVLKLWEEPITMGRNKSCCEWNMILLWVELNTIVGGSWCCGWSS